MNSDTSRDTQAEIPVNPPGSNVDEAPSLEQLMAVTRDLYAEYTGQVRGIAELAFLELELAISSLQWWVWTLALFSVCSVMTFTFLISAVLIVFTDTTLSPTAAMLLMGGTSATLALLLFYCMKVLARKMVFTTLRKHLTQPQGEEHAETRP